MPVSYLLRIVAVMCFVVPAFITAVTGVSFEAGAVKTIYLAVAAVFLMQVASYIDEQE